MKAQLSFWAIVVLLAVSASAGTYSSGDGSPENPYRIATAEDLNDIGKHPEDFNKCFLLVADINLAGYGGYNIICGEPSGGWYTMFEGVFDGNDHTISNLTINENRSMVGLFGYIGDNGIIQNTTLKTIDYKGIHYVGGVAGRNEGKILNCHVLGTIEGDQDCGGITGASLGPLPNQSQILNCSFRGKVRGAWATGGIVGSTDGPEISECYAIVDINGVWQCGGVVGHNTGGNLKRCFAKGVISCSEHSAGGFVGVTYDHCGYGGDIQNCYADVIVNCSNQAGGFSGSAPGQYGEIRNAYCCGKVVYDVNDYSDVGGFIGEERPPQGVFYSFFLETSGPDNGFGELLTPEQMQNRSTFTDAGWDFVEIWNIGEHQTYPFLRIYPAGDLNHDGRVDMLDFAIFASHWLEGAGQ